MVQPSSLSFSLARMQRNECAHKRQRRPLTHPPVSPSPACCVRPRARVLVCAWARMPSVFTAPHALYSQQFHREPAVEKQNLP
eukprot:scaffold21487_cov105-Isochrysis_galbana.AAC.4